MAVRENDRRVLIGGYYAAGDGYPNGQVTQRLLEEQLCLPVLDYGKPLPADRHLWKMASAGIAAKLGSGSAMVVHNAYSALRVLWHCRRKHDVVYVRYPAIPFMLLMSLLPKRIRPRCYVDAFISIWDSMFVDRARNQSGIASRVLRAMERRALGAADKVLVDTAANAIYLAQQFNLPTKSVTALPLGVDERKWAPAAGLARSDPRFCVLFIGTFIPLHGIDTITSAIDQFAAHENVRFLFVGNGQESHRLSALIEKRPELRIEWEQRWQSSEQLAQQVANADVCLGIFGGAGKAARVLPYKLYLYLCVGTAIITQSDLSTPTGSEKPPAVLLESNTPDALASAIRMLQGNALLRQQLVMAGRDYFKRCLSNAALATAWAEMLRADNAEERGALSAEQAPLH